MSVDAIWIESSKGGKAAWSNRKLYIAVDDAALFLDAGNEGVEIISSGGDIYYPANSCKEDLTHKNSQLCSIHCLLGCIEKLLKN